jgi:hypothetical protein
MSDLSDKEGGSSIRHVEPSSVRPSAPTDNPSASDAFNVVLSIPESIEVRMVDASALGDYEIWVFIASLLSNFAIGFVVAYTQEVKTNSSVATYVGWTAVAFLVLFFVSVLIAFGKRRALRRKGKRIALKNSGVAVLKDP